MTLHPQGGQFENLPPVMSLDEFRAYAAEVLAPPPFVSKLGGGFAHDLVGKSVKREWLLKGTMLARTFGLVIGPPGCGKSFLMLDLAATQAAAAVEKPSFPEWFGRRVMPCGVVYISAEGQEDFTFRIRAWLQARGTPDLRWPFFLIPSAIDMRSGNAPTDLLISEVKAVDEICQREFGFGVGLVVVDTVNRALAGGNENASEVMGAFVMNCGRVKDECKVAVIGVHHEAQNKEGPTGKGRGHGSLHGATDTEIAVTGAAEGAPNKWRLTRFKAGPTGATHEFRLKSERLGVDEDGEEITSCVVRRLAADPSVEGAEIKDNAEEARSGKAHMTADGRVILRENLTAVLKALVKATEAEDSAPPVTARIPHGRPATTIKHWTDEILRALPIEDKEDPKARDRARKAREAGAMKLMARSIIEIDGDWVWRTQRRVASVDPAESSGYPRQYSENKAMASIPDDEMAPY